MIGVTCFTLILACAVYSSGEGVDRQDLIVAVVSAGLAAATWWLPHRAGERAVAQRLDRKLGLGGAYFTAWEVESGALKSTPLARLLTRRIEARVKSAHAVRTTLPHSAPWIAAPFIGAAVLALTLAEVRTSAERMSAAAATTSLANALADLRSETSRSGDLPSEDFAGLGELLEEARELAADDGLDPAEAKRRMEGLVQELGRLAANSPPHSDLRRELEESQVLADQALMTLPDSVNPPDSGKTPAKPSASRGSEVASGAEVGTMFGSPTGEASPTAGAMERTTKITGENAANSAGVFSRGRWWPARYDELVSTWVEARRDLD